jgi:hypothetical protein
MEDGGWRHSLSSILYLWFCVTLSSCHSSSNAGCPMIRVSASPDKWLHDDQAFSTPRSSPPASSISISVIEQLRLGWAISAGRSISLQISFSVNVKCRHGPRSAHADSVGRAAPPRCPSACVRAAYDSSRLWGTRVFISLSYHTQNATSTKSVNSYTKFY